MAVDRYELEGRDVYKLDQTKHSCLVITPQTRDYARVPFAENGMTAGAVKSNPPIQA
jgi:hypothetical protein